MKKFIRYSSLALLSTTLATGVNAALTDDVNLTGTIAPSISIAVPDASTAVTMEDGEVTSQNLTVASNVDFTITVDSSNDLKMKRGATKQYVPLRDMFVHLDQEAFQPGCGPCPRR
jgi:hypothetical protein